MRARTDYWSLRASPLRGRTSTVQRRFAALSNRLACHGGSNRLPALIGTHRIS